MTFEEVIDRRWAVMRQIMIDRQRKYGPENIEASGIHGLVVRMKDKLARIDHDHKKCPFGGPCAKPPQYTDEQLLDAYIDLANYAGVIAPMLLLGEWAPPLAEDEIKKEKT